MLTVPEAAQRLGLTKRFVRALAGSGGFAGAEHHEGHWLIPEEAVRPTGGQPGPAWPEERREDQPSPARR